jgi:DmsE family decaheme c-type cytochrome
MRSLRILRALAPAVVGLLLAAARQAHAQGAAAQCTDCHEAVVKAFAANPHLRGAKSVQATCESCHEGARAHAETGDPAQVLGFKTAGAERIGAACLHCHARERRLGLWKGSAHELQEVSCTGCHSVHGGNPRLLASGDEGSTCFACHFDVRADVMKRSIHPLRDASRLSMGGKMSCSSCHNPHGARSRALVDARSVNDKCFECHTEKKAPVLWEHGPVKEDCLICHTPHGSSNDKLLVSRVPRLCQECHMQGRHQTGTLAPNSTFAFNRSCLNCHPQIHGSNNPSGPILQR